MREPPSRSQDGRAELPTPNSTKSYWHRDPSPTLLGHRTTEDLPAEADLVVIGSGIAGAFAARELVAGGRNVLMVEAREACWGATGRNGGHCQPRVLYAEAEIARFELETFQMIANLVAEHDIPCDWQVVGGIHAIFVPELLDVALKQMSRLQRYPDLKDKAVVIVDKDELAAQHIPEALGAVYQPNAAKLWPYKLVAWILETLLQKHDAENFNLQTNTPVTRLEKHGSSWICDTPRGQIRAREVLLTTNGYTSHLLPGMTDIIVPVRGQVAALEPTEGSVQLPHSYVWTMGDDDQYLIHRSTNDSQVSVSGSRDRSLILGGERWAVPEGEEGISRDDVVNPVLSRALHRSLNHAVKLLPKGEPDREELHANYEWTGIMGYSRDLDPWVGRAPTSSIFGHPDKGSTEGLWMCAGFTGHGMPVAPRCGIAVAEAIFGIEGGVKLPTNWVPSEKRMNSAKVLELPRGVHDLIKLMPAV
ncbi:FAD dependent oxidoreductase [Xylariaceae sp. FL1272]|nr:FAD dependent oxidoreductase [Xylariaceae sp. FL1272]